MVVKSSTYHNLKDKYDNLYKQFLSMKSTLKTNTKLNIEQLELQKNKYEEKLEFYKNELKDLKNDYIINDLFKENLEFNDDIFKNIQRNKESFHVYNLKQKILENPNFIDCFYIAKLNDKKYLIDGQHRYYACNLIKKENNFDKIKNEKIKIIFKNYENYKDLEFDYKTLNYKQGQNIFNDKNINWKKIKNYLNKYQKYFKSDQGRCNRPYIRINIFIQTLKDNIKDFNLNKDNLEKDLIKKISKLNKYYYYKWLDRPDISGLKTIRKMYFSKNIPMFFFGIENNWLNDLINFDNLPIKPIETIRPVINDTFREIIFRDHIGCGSGFCFCCMKEPITRNNFHLGHIIPIILNGLTNRHNLIPICGNCNFKMGTKKMFDYMIDKKINVDYGESLKKKFELNPSLYQYID